MRVWQVPAGLVTTILIALFFSKADQGIYYTLGSLIGLQALADSGLLNVILHVVSHDWAELRLDDRGFVRGPRRSRQRLSAIIRFGLIWFALAAPILFAIGMIVGFTTFEKQQVTATVFGPLLLAMMMASVSLVLTPLVAILEGCNQVNVVNRYRLMQAVTGSIVVWICLVGGMNLWTPLFAILVQAIWEAALIFVRYRKLFCQAWRTTAKNFDWRTEIWPLQWRVGIQSAVRYLAVFPMLPVLFAYQGADVAGQVGMTWQVLNNILMMAYAWVRTRAPEFGRLIALRDVQALQRLFLQTTIGSTVLLVSGLSAFWILVFGLRLGTLDWGTKLADRFLDPVAMAWFAAALIPLHLSVCFGTHLRSQKIDPIWKVSVVSYLVLGAAIYVAARYIGPASVGAAMLVVFAGMAVPVFLIWLHYHRRMIDQQRLVEPVNIR